MSYKVVNLTDMLNKIGETDTTTVLSDFCCSMAPDVETFLRSKAIEFSKRGWAQSHLVFDEQYNALLGYFTLALKVITVPLANISKSTQKRIESFSTFDSFINSFCLPAPLIAQLGKNFHNGNNRLITGNDLLAIACDKVSSILNDMGGRFTYLECEDKPSLINFYKRNGFYEFNRRNLNINEKSLFSGQYLVQMLRKV